MKHGKNSVFPLLFTFLLLFSGGCSRTVEQTAGSGSASGLTMKATFVRENETPLSGCTIRFSRGENSVDYQPNQDGTMTVSGLPAEGQLTVSILDRQADPLGTITLTFSRGAVIDAVTDEDSVGHITLTEDAQEIALCFTLYHDGTLRCQLQLAESRIV